MSDLILRVENLSAGYGVFKVLHDLNLSVGKGEIVSVLGANGAGKTTLLGALSGTVRSSGVITFQGISIEGFSTHKRAAAGLGHCPHGRGTFVDLTVEQNLLIGGLGQSAGDNQEALERWYTMFPILRERRHQQAGRLSGGEQQMLAISRSLMGRPSLLMLDEPSLGLSPLLTAQVIRHLKDINESTGISLLLVEQNASQALKISDRAYVMQTGEFVAEGDAAAVADDDVVRRAYLGA